MKWSKVEFCIIQYKSKMSICKIHNMFIKCSRMLLKIHHGGRLKNLVSRFISQEWKYCRCNCNPVWPNLLYCTFNVHCTCRQACCSFRHQIVLGLILIPYLSNSTNQQTVRRQWCLFQPAAPRSLQYTFLVASLHSLRFLAECTLKCTFLYLLHCAMRFLEQSYYIVIMTKIMLNCI